MPSHLRLIPAARSLRRCLACSECAIELADRASFELAIRFRMPVFRKPVQSARLCHLCLARIGG